MDVEKFLREITLFLSVVRAFHSYSWHGCKLRLSHRHGWSNIFCLFVESKSLLLEKETNPFF